MLRQNQELTLKAAEYDHTSNGELFTAFVNIKSRDERELSNHIGLELKYETRIIAEVQLIANKPKVSVDRAPGEIR